ncbi:MAG: hypothetical protein LLF94_11675 [Chlamydiales bacterium]|nr:hypothetical protein [Chlamydiales bacterium]
MKYMLLVIAFVVSSCYRMPDDGEVSTLPNTNNPQLTGHKETPLMPGIKY